MPENMTELYNSLSFSSQQEVYDFMLFLLQKQEKGTLLEQRFVKREKRKAALAEFAGSMKELWEVSARMLTHIRGKERRG